VTVGKSATGQPLFPRSGREKNRDLSEDRRKIEKKAACGGTISVTVGGRGGTTKFDYLGSWTEGFEA